MPIRNATLPPILIAGLLLGLTVLGPAVAVDDVLQQAREDLREGRTQSAAIRLKTRLQQDPNDAAARLLLGQLHLDTGNPSAAVEEIDRALDLGADEIDALPALGRALLKNRDFDQLFERIQPPVSGDPNWRAELLGLRGAALLATQQIDRARRLFEQARELAPELALPLIGLAQLAAIDQDEQQLRSLLEQAVAAEPGSDQAWESLGALEQQQRRYAKAAEAFGEAIRRKPARWTLHYRRALANIELKERAAVREDLRILHRQAKRFPGIQYLRGRLALLEDDPAAATEAFEAYLRAVPEDPRGLYYAALALQQNGRLAQAEEYLFRLQASYPKNPMTATLLALTRLQSGNPKGAEEAIRPLAQATDATPGQLELLRRAVLAQGRSDEALALTERLVAMRPDETRPRIALAQQLIRSGDYATARDELEQVLSLAPTALDARILLIRAQIGLGDQAGAEQASKRLLEEWPDRALTHNVRAAVLALQGDRDAAKAAFEQALILDPASTRAALGLAALEIRSNQTGAARKTLAGLLQNDPGNTTAVLALASLDRHEGGTAAYTKRLAKALRKDPQDIALRLSMAGAFLNDGDGEAAERVLQETPPDQAESVAVLALRAQAALIDDRPEMALFTLKRVAQLQPDRPQVHFLMATTALEIGDSRAAEQHMLDGLEHDQAETLGRNSLARILNGLPHPGDREALLERLLSAAPSHKTLITAKAANALDQRDFDTALTLLKQARDDQPDDPVRVMDLARGYDRADQPTMALGTLQDWLDGHPEAAAPRMLLAEIALRNDRLDLAKAQYRKVLALSPQSPTALNNLAMLMADESPRRALPLAERAYDLRPDNPAFKDTLGTVLLNLGEIDRALPLLAEAHRGSEDPSISFRYAKALAAAGRSREARLLLLEINLRPFPEQAQAQTLLKELR